MSKFIDLFEQSQIAYVKQVDYNNLTTQNNVEHGNILIHTNDPHPAIILNKYEDENSLLVLCGQSITEEKLEKFTYIHVGNDYIVLKSAHTGLTEDTLFQLHSRNINILKCNKTNFQKKNGSYILGTLNQIEKNTFNRKLNQYPQIHEIISYLEDNGCQILPKKENQTHYTNYH